LLRSHVTFEIVKTALQQNETLVTDVPVVKQPIGEAGVLALLALLSAFIPLSTDMYLPALPTMTATFHASEQLINLTLILFFVFYSAGTLLWGPLSDKYGRKPVLLCGLALYVLASVSCACARDVNQLIVFRVLQALAGSASPAIAVALVKDLFHGRKREHGLVIIQSMVMIAPIIAPVIGAMLLKFTVWRGIFWTLASFGAVALVWSFALRETVVSRYEGTVLQTMGQLGTVLKNRGFTALLIIFSLVIMPLYAYLAASSYVYIREFHQSELAYSLYFGGNALSAVVAPWVFLHVSRQVHSRVIITACAVVIAISGISLCTLGRLYPWLFACSVIPATMAMGIIRPPSTHLMLEQHHGATGTASSLINCTMSLVGSIGMLLMSCGWHSIIIPLGLVHLIAGGGSAIAWLSISRKPFIKQVPEVPPVEMAAE